MIIYSLYVRRWSAKPILICRMMPQRCHTTRGICRANTCFLPIGSAWNQPRASPRLLTCQSLQQGQRRDDGFFFNGENDFLLFKIRPPISIAANTKSILQHTRAHTIYFLSKNDWPHLTKDLYVYIFQLKAPFSRMNQNYLIN